MNCLCQNNYSLWNSPTVVGFRLEKTYYVLQTSNSGGRSITVTATVDELLYWYCYYKIKLLIFQADNILLNNIVLYKIKARGKIVNINILRIYINYSNNHFPTTIQKIYICCNIIIGSNWIILFIRYFQFCFPKTVDVFIFYMELIWYLLYNVYFISSLILNE